MTLEINQPRSMIQRRKLQESETLIPNRMLRLSPSEEMLTESLATAMTLKRTLRALKPEMPNLAVKLEPSIFRIRRERMDYMVSKKILKIKDTLMEI